MAKLPESLHDWPGDRFATTLVREIGALPSGSLPLARAALHSGYVDESELRVAVLALEQGRVPRARIAVFFHELIIGCSCGDDPPRESAYCEMAVSIDPDSAEASFRLPE